MKIRLKKYISIFLFLIVSLFIIPVELIHNLYGHEDTMCFPHTGKTIENNHHHCDILKYHAPVYVAIAKIECVKQHQKIFIKNVFEYTFTFSQVFNSILLRGPPLNIHS